MNIEDNIDLMARHYVEVIEGPPNGWGQHVSPIYGQSHHIMNRMSQLYGTGAMNRAIDKAFQEYNGNA